MRAALSAEADTGTANTSSPGKNASRSTSPMGEST